MVNGKYELNLQIAGHFTINNCFALPLIQMDYCRLFAGDSFLIRQLFFEPHLFYYEPQIHGNGISGHFTFLHRRIHEKC